MRVTRCVFLVAVALSAAVYTSATLREKRSTVRGSPIQKVMDLLEGLKARAQNDTDTESYQYATYAQWCRDTTRTKNRDIKAEKDEVAAYKAQVVSAVADVAEFDAEIINLEVSISKNTADLADAALNRKAEAEAALAAAIDYNQTLTSLRSAIARIDQSKNFQYKNSSSTASLSVARPTVHRAASSGTEQSAPVAQQKSESSGDSSSFSAVDIIRKMLLRTEKRSFLQVSRQNPTATDFSNRVPERKVYEFKSGSVHELLKKLEGKVVDDMRASASEEANRVSLFQLTKQDLESVIDTSKSAKDTKVSEKAARGQDQATASKALMEAEATLAKDVAYLEEVNAQCMTKQTEFEERRHVRSQEMTLFQKAIETLSKVSGVQSPDDITDRLASAYNKTAPSAEASFLQMKSIIARMKSRSPVSLMARRFDKKKVQAIEEALQLVRAARNSAGSSAQDLDELMTGLEEAASVGANDKPEGVCRFCDKSPFDTLKQMIQKLVFKLKQDQIDEDNHKAWCDEEMRKSLQSNSTKTSRAEQLDANLAQLAADQQTLASELFNLEKSIGELQSQMEQQTVIRLENKKENERAVSDAEAAQAALATAVKMLSEFYVQTGAMAAPSLIEKDGSEGEKDKEEDAYQAADTALQQEAAPGLWTSPLQQTSGGTDLVQLLSSLQQSYAVVEADTKAAELTDARQYKELMETSRATLATYQEDQRLKNKRKADITELAAQRTADRKIVQKELDAAAQYLRDLGHPCGETGSSFTERKTAREAEIGALQQAEVTLKAAFSQVEATA